MRLPIYQVDAFSREIFRGNPAAVCPLDAWISDAQMQSIAAENNLAETAFFVPEGADFSIRWFTPEAEVPLCGHATLASALIAFRLGKFQDTITFHSRSGPLLVQKKGDLYSLNFPARLSGPQIDTPAQIVAAIGKRPAKFFRSEPNYLAIFDSETDVRSMQPDFSKLKEAVDHGLIVSAPGKDYDMVSRFFAPAVGVDEDPVTGSAHCTLIPYWAGVLGKNNLKAFQASARGGELFCENLGDRVVFSGYGSLYLEGQIEIA